MELNWLNLYLNNLYLIMLHNSNNNHNKLNFKSIINLNKIMFNKCKKNKIFYKLIKCKKNLNAIQNKIIILSK